MQYSWVASFLVWDDPVGVINELNGAAFIGFRWYFFLFRYQESPTSEFWSSALDVQPPAPIRNSIFSHQLPLSNKRPTSQKGSALFLVALASCSSAAFVKCLNYWGKKRLQTRVDGAILSSTLWDCHKLSLEFPPREMRERDFISML